MATFLTADSSCHSTPFCNAKNVQQTTQVFVSSANDVQRVNSVADLTMPVTVGSPSVALPGNHGHGTSVATDM